MCNYLVKYILLESCSEPQPETIIIEDDDSDQDPFMSSQSDTQHAVTAGQHLSSDQDILKVKVYKDVSCLF